MTRSRPEGVELPDDVPNPKTTPFPFTRGFLAPGQPCGFDRQRWAMLQGFLKSSIAGKQSE